MAPDGGAKLASSLTTKNTIPALPGVSWARREELGVWLLIRIACDLRVSPTKTANREFPDRSERARQRRAIPRSISSDVGPAVGRRKYREFQHRGRWRRSGAGPRHRGARSASPSAMTMRFRSFYRKLAQKRRVSSWTRRPSAFTEDDRQSATGMCLLRPRVRRSRNGAFVLAPAQGRHTCQTGRKTYGHSHHHRAVGRGGWREAGTEARRDRGRTSIRLPVTDCGASRVPKLAA